MQAGFEVELPQPVSNADKETPTKTSQRLIGLIFADLSALINIRCGGGFVLVKRSTSTFRGALNDFAPGRRDPGTSLDTGDIDAVDRCDHVADNEVRFGAPRDAHDVPSTSTSENQHSTPSASPNAHQEALAVPSLRALNESAQSSTEVSSSAWSSLAGRSSARPINGPRSNPAVTATRSAVESWSVSTSLVNRCRNSVSSKIPT